jgi:hypothetical protein
LDEETFEALGRLEGRIEALRLAFLGLVVILTSRDRTLEEEMETQLHGDYVNSSDKNPHSAMLQELTDLMNELAGLREARG